MPTTSGSSVLFMAFPAHDAPGLAGWTSFRDLISRGMAGAEPAQEARDPRPAATERPLGIWRMLASNHREIARSARAYPSFESARIAVLELQQLAQSFEIRTFHGPSSSTHGWVALSDGRAALTCARWYETASVSLDVATLSVAAFGSATVAESPWHRAASSRNSRVPAPAW